MCLIGTGKDILYSYEEEILLDMDFIDSWSGELARMKEGKVGTSFLYPESFLAMLSVMLGYLVPYKQLEGFTMVK